MAYPFDQAPGTLPLVVTGVDPQTAQAPAPAQPAPNQLQFQQQPQFQAPQASLPEILSAIAGIGLNIGGMSNGAGAVGNGALQMANQIGEKNLQKAQMAFQEDQRKAKLAGDQKQSQANFDRLMKLTNDPAVLAQGRAYGEAGDEGKLNALVNHTETMVHYDKAQAKALKAQQDAWAKGEIGAYAKGLEDDQKRIAKSLNPDVVKDVRIQNLVEDYFKTNGALPANAQAMQNLLTAKGSPVSIDQAQEYLTEFQALKNKAEPGFGSRLWGKLPFTDPRVTTDPKPLFATWAANRHGGQNVIDDHLRLVNQHAENSQQLNKLNIINELMKNPKTQGKAQEGLTQFRERALKSLQGQEQQQAPPAAPPAATLTEEDKKAIAWAKKNPNDEKAKKILDLHKIK